MKTYNVTIIAIQLITHNVLRIITKKPPGFEFEPGQASEVAINKKGWTQEGRPFTFTSLPQDEHLEFMIKIYPEHLGVTKEMLQLKPRDQLVLSEVFGVITYKGSGVFIAGGAGITPFISILRSLKGQDALESSALIFANKSMEDVIIKNELAHILDGRVSHIFSEEDRLGFAHGHITKEFLQSNIQSFNQQFYLCGPPPFMDSVLSQLTELGVDQRAIIIEM